MAKEARPLQVSVVGYPSSIGRTLALLSITYRFFNRAAGLALAVMLLPPATVAEEAASAGEALKAGRVSLALRLRHETVSDDRTR